MRVENKNKNSARSRIGRGTRLLIEFFVGSTPIERRESGNIVLKRRKMFEKIISREREYKK